MTLLPTNEVSGLSIESDDGWFAVNQEPESFVVNAGDTLRAWSNNRFRSTKHRALNKGAANRYAIPFFFDPRPDTIIEPLPGCINEDRPAAVKPYRYGDYLQNFMRDGYIPAAN
jgi:isopenicillin N synthase-like dioxygenase